jgi:hypothetical protein
MLIQLWTLSINVSDHVLGSHVPMGYRVLPEGLIRSGNSRATCTILPSNESLIKHYFALDDHRHKLQATVYFPWTMLECLEHVQNIAHSHYCTTASAATFAQTRLMERTTHLPNFLDQKQCHCAQCRQWPHPINVGLKRPKACSEDVQCVV